MKFAEQQNEILYMPQSIAHRDEIEGRMSKGKVLAEGLHQRNRAPLLIFVQHPGAGVEADDVRSRKSKIKRSLRFKARARGHIKQPHARFEPRAAQREFPIRAASPEGKCA